MNINIRYTHKDNYTVMDKGQITNQTQIVLKSKSSKLLLVTSEDNSKAYSKENSIDKYFICKEQPEWKRIIIKYPSEHALYSLYT